jgi:FtsH-binding integral membrane protein
MKGIYTYIPETNNVPKEYNVAAILSLLFMVPISLVIIIIIIIMWKNSEVKWVISE